MKMMKSEEEDDEVARIDKCSIAKMVNTEQRHDPCSNTMLIITRSTYMVISYQSAIKRITICMAS
jgi:hypothetical protein